MNEKKIKNKLNVSVLMATFNGVAFLEEAIASLTKQTRLPEELVIVEDASTDGTWELISNLLHGFPIPTQLIRLPQNSGGPAHPLNAACKVASGDLIAILDQDDRFLPNKLASQVEVLESSSDIDFVFSKANFFGSPQLKDKGLFPLNGSQPLADQTLLALLLQHKNFIRGYPALLFRRECWSKVGGFSERFRIASDYDFFCALSANTKGYFLDEFCYERRLHDKNHSSQRESRWECAQIRRQWLSQLQDTHLRESFFNEIEREYFCELSFQHRNSGAYLRSIQESLNSFKHGLTVRSVGGALKSLGLHLNSLFDRNRSAC